jgi:hypothetical protein
LNHSVEVWECKDKSLSIIRASRPSVLANWLIGFQSIRDASRTSVGRLRDLLPFVRKHIYHPKFHGSLSVKSVLPALVPDMTYDGMEVADGNDAGLAWERIIRGELDPAERQQLKAALLAYCRQDTLAMVKILERLRAV